MQIISLDQRDRWDAFVQNFKNWDIYYLNSYARSLKAHGDGEPFLCFFENAYCRICYVIFLKDIADEACFSTLIAKDKYYDVETPYGYGGPLVEGDFNENSRMQFIDELTEFCTSKGIISQFIRFHPLLHNNQCFDTISEMITRQHTVFIDTSSEKTIWTNLDAKNRNMIRKAQKLGVKILVDKGERFHDFLMLYNVTMQRHEAEDYYFFKEDYYSVLLNDMSENIMFFYAYFEGKIISSAIFFYNSYFMHYHLSGGDYAYRSYAPTNLLLYEAAVWAANRHIALLHLGGGAGSDDSLFAFKKQFNKNGILPFYIGRNIFDTERYNELMQIRLKNDSIFDLNNSYLIQYRR